jgi:fumarylacetoacetate (FAA) hydrolase
VLVDRELALFVPVPEVAATMQEALDHWAEVAPRLHELSVELQSGKVSQARPFDPKECAAPLPRGHHWADGSAYVNHVELVRKARGAELPASFWTDPLMYQGGSDDFLGPCDDAPFVSEEHGIDIEAEVAVITDDVPIGVSVAKAASHIKLLMLVNDWSLRNLIPGELAKGFGFYQSKPATAFSPVAASPDELGNAWQDGKVHLTLISRINDQLLGQPNAGVDMTFSFPQLIAHAAKTRKLGAGAIIGSGTVSNVDRSSGSSCLAEVRMLEQLQHGSPRTSFLKFGDRVRIEMLGASGGNIFGRIEQHVTRI